MRISPEKLRSEAESTGFREEILEKVIQLLNLLDGFRKHPFLKGRMALKGGTALNLFIFDVPRLSVDIDLNYIGAVEREVMLAERPQFEDAIRAVCEREDMIVGDFPTHHAGGKCLLKYTSAKGNGGNLEIDPNFMQRIPLWDVTEMNSRPVGSYKAGRIPVLDIHELAAGKLAALFSRQTGRDLFDVHQLLTQCKLDTQRLRLGFTVYGGMNRKDWRKVKIDDLEFNERDLSHHLLPLLRRDHAASTGDPASWTERLVAECRKELEVLLPFNESELEFLTRLLEAGEINAGLLTSDQSMIDRINQQPMLKWKASNVRKFKGLDS